ncbi:MAG: VOC family protein [candidate division SR1 bacterium]|nr:VOC family protein [candidate division SR1 bacterium]
MNRVVHFEIQAGDLERAAKFYREIFGWKIEKRDSPEMEYWMIMTADKDSKEPGINGGLLKRPTTNLPQGCGTNAFVCTVVVNDFDATATKIIATGGMEAMPKFKIADMAWQGYFIDTEGNTFGIHQEIKK